MNKIFGIDISNIPAQPTEIFVGFQPKVNCKNRILQKVFVKIFGYKPIYETRMAKVVTTGIEDCPKEWNRNITLTLGENKEQEMIYKISL